MAKGSVGKAQSNADLAKQVVEAQLKVAQAQKAANLIQAKIEAKGKNVIRDYSPDGTIIRVTDQKDIRVGGAPRRRHL